ncbi:hypothetical protein EN803_25515 [Mesorhizobium sp. M2D.F.Ca.ET.160.01.1.1]|nr:hypothetical protein EN803_25515 [Mesorhizobium sp. M2D.F.Ca.ET.160.01.1.1]
MAPRTRARLVALSVVAQSRFTKTIKRAWSLRFIELAFLAAIIINVVPSMDFLSWWLTLALLVAWTARLI